MTVNLPQKAGFAPTVAEWDALVRIAENLAAQLAQAQAERDAARAEVARLTAENDFLNGGAVADKQAIDTLLAENERLTNVIGFIENELQMSIGVGPFWDVMHDVHLFKGSLIDLCLAKLPEALRKPAPAGGEARK